MGNCACLGGRNNNNGNEQVSAIVTNSAAAVEINVLRAELTSGSSNVKMFSYDELAAATNNFDDESRIGGGSFGPVFRGELKETAQIVAVKALNLNGIQGNKEFIMEVRTLSRVHHPNLINLIGCCIDGERRLLVYELMPLGSLKDHLHGRNPPLDWNTRIEIASGVARALYYLHHEAQPPVVYRDLRPDNILLNEDFTPKISDFGIAMLLPDQNNPRVLINNMMVEITTKSDVHDFGVVLLELLTGQKAADSRRETHYLAHWVRHKLRDTNNYVSVADPKLRGKYPEDAFVELIKLGIKCTEMEEKLRPGMKGVSRTIDNWMPPKDEKRVPTKGEAGTSGVKD